MHHSFDSVRLYWFCFENKSNNWASWREARAVFWIRWPDVSTRPSRAVCKWSGRQGQFFLLCRRGQTGTRCCAKEKGHGQRSWKVIHHNGQKTQSRKKASLDVGTWSEHPEKPLGPLRPVNPKKPELELAHSLSHLCRKQLEHKEEGGS